jgi:class 3 adenylate cyclase/CheY-like chemotaxis protein
LPRFGRAFGERNREPTVRTPPLILVADDNPSNLDVFRTRLSLHGYEIIVASDGEEALARAREKLPDLIVLDVMMPKLDGVEACRELKADASLPFIPVILVTAKSDPRDVVIGLEAGAEEYLTKPVEQTALIARIKSMLRIKALHDENQAQSARLENQAAELTRLNAKLEQRVSEQRQELERVGQLKRFFSPPLAEFIVSSGEEELMASHRREITVVFCDLRGYTAFSEVAEPEEVLAALREYHAAVGPLIFQNEGTLEHFAGDGLMVIFNDPVPCEDPARRAVRMALGMREGVIRLAKAWRRRGHELGLGVGIAMGYASLGQIGFEGRFHYGAIGTVLNVASRLCDRAETGQILLTERVGSEVEDLVETEPLGELSLRGLTKPVAAVSVKGLRKTMA